jgi:hypothetical protein
LPAGSAHIFANHLLPARSPGALPAPTDQPVWIPVYLIICLALLVVIRSTAFPRLIKMFQSTFGGQVIQQLEREEVNLFRTNSLALTLLFILNAAFLFFKLNEVKDYVLVESTGLQQFLFFVLMISLAMMLKGLANRLIVVVTGEKKIMGDYVISSTLVNQTFGIALFPCLVLLQFSHLFPAFFLILGLSVWGLSILMRWYKGLQVSLGEQGVGFLQIFSYFCTLEILPILVLVKYVVETF